MKGTKRAAVIILAVVLIVGCAVGWSVWRKHATTQADSPSAVPTYTATPNTGGTATPEASETPSASPSATISDNQKLVDAAALEKTMRNWGTDPTVDLHTLAKKPVEDVANKLHTDTVTENPIPTMSTVSINIGSSAGPTASSMYCTDTSGNYEKACETYPMMGQWWAQEAWGYGARWMGEPQASMNDDGSVQVTGQVRTFLVQDGDKFSGKYWALTPAWKTYDINDRITFDSDGKISGVSSLNDDPWWINPYLNTWNDDMPEELADTGERIAIPVVGAPPAVIKLNYMSGHHRLKGPGTMADLDGTVNWDLFTDDGECMASCGSGRQG